MDAVGVRELKAHLSQYLKKVRDGDTLLVTDRGKPVATIMPAGIPGEIARLVASGQARWSGKRFVPPANLAKPRIGAPLASDLISEERR
jgi:prevent-host-death family protein